jgi:KUP system potassium uptake protein
MTSTPANPTLDTAASSARHPDRQGLAALTLGALGVVYGDIGTSPLYTVKEIFAPHTGVPLDAAHIVGAVSAIFWALMLVVTLKYVTLVLRADNRGEGGVLALAALASQAVRRRPQLHAGLVLLGVFGATLFYGDSLITPAISVLGAMEGLGIVSPSLASYAVPASIVILVALFAVQRHGTALVGRFFGPVIVLWFATLGVTGLVHIAARPSILAALNPLLAVGFLVDRGWLAFAALGAIVLAITGAEALYADIGHFGRRPIRLAWNLLVLPSLAINYLGQGALLIADPSAIENPFYRLFPSAWVVPALALATLAAITASQATISGAYSVTRQAIQLGFLPRLAVRFTSARESGQIYMPAVNWTMLVGVLALVLVFGSSSALAGAYGIAVTLTMTITTVLTWFVVREGWRLPGPLAAGATAFFLSIDLLLFAGCAVKFLEGGWVPIALGLVIFTLMSTWARGRALMIDSLRSDGLDLETFVAGLHAASLHRAERTAVYLSTDPSTVPQALLHNLKHNQVLHRQNVVATVVFRDVPWVAPGERVHVEAIGHDFWRVRIEFGFVETPDVPRGLALARAQGLDVPPFETTWFLSRQTVVPTPGGGMVQWRETLFAAMSRNASGVAAFFGLPDNAVVELGTRVQI